MKKPVIGVTPDIELRPEGNPPRDLYFLDARNFDALRAVGATPIILPHEMDEIDAYLDLIDGLLVSGGGYQFRHPKLFAHDGTEPPEKERRTRFEMAMLARAIELDRPVLAVCGGFQTLNVVTGGDIVIALGKERPEWDAHRGRSYVEPAHSIRITPDTKLASAMQATEAAVNSRHYQGVTRVGEGVVVSAVSDDGVVEAIELPDSRFCIGTQWHPEFFLSEPERRLFDAFVEASRG